MSEYVKIFDTPLRDGEQSPGASMNREEKLQLAGPAGRGHHGGGLPAANPGDFEDVKLIAQQVKGPVICVLACTREADIRAA